MNLKESNPSLTLRQQDILRELKEPLTIKDLNELHEDVGYWAIRGDIQILVAAGLVKKYPLKRGKEELYELVYAETSSKTPVIPVGEGKTVSFTEALAKLTHFGKPGLRFAGAVGHIVLRAQSVAQDNTLYLVEPGKKRCWLSMQEARKEILDILGVMDRYLSFEELSPTENKEFSERLTSWGKAFSQEAWDKLDDYYLKNVGE